ncbi:MAG: hypothetical protein A2X61_01730 [Ignavibacteria bacterium GWB2_35_12]|nr:MAG: hypothetical protein A2X61_01730 [Ignavibacteria bacterium GWB2_35_12]OGU92855.1 MAG: hypothetical protein A2220_14560 [Ignavibacteria bacterium RIFOXYA2_FULL_35_10]OGV19554.1 MAG: hypothetical protein A2475_07425 [Ignavibacteria bacterium RIFOXYC2_FULL_35_21]
MPVETKTSYKQAINIIKKMNQKDKVKLANYINEITLKDWLIDFRKRMKNIPITFDEITEIVEEVRQARYESSN